MNRRQLKVIVALLAVAVLLYSPSLFRRDGNGGSLDTGAGFTFELAGSPSRVDIISLADADTIRLEREPEGWTVDGHPADSAKVADLLGVVGDLQAGDLIARNPANHDALGVSDTGGRRIEVYTESEEPRAFHLGNRDLSAGGYYVRAPGTAEVFRLESPAGGYLSRERDGWRDRLIARVDTSAVREILIRRGSDDVVLRRTEAGWRVGEVPADSESVARLLGILPEMSSTGFPTDSLAETTDFTSPDAELDVFAEDTGDVTGRRLVLALKLIEGEGGAWLVRRADDPEVFELSSFTMGRLLPSREALEKGEG